MSPELLKVPLPSFWGEITRDLRQSSAPHLPRKVSKFIFSTSPSLSRSFCLHSPSFFLPLCLSSLVLLSTACLSSHAVHTTLSQSIQWNRAQTVYWDIIHSPEGWSGRRRKGGGSQIYNFIWISPVNRALGLHCSRAGPVYRGRSQSPFYQKHLFSVVFSEHWVLLMHLVFLEDCSKWLKKNQLNSRKCITSFGCFLIIQSV